MPGDNRQANNDEGGGERREGRRDLWTASFTVLISYLK